MSLHVHELVVHGDGGAVETAACTVQPASPYRLHPFHTSILLHLQIIVKCACNNAIFISIHSSPFCRPAYACIPKGGLQNCKGDRTSILFCVGRVAGRGRAGRIVLGHTTAQLHIAWTARCSTAACRMDGGMRETERS